MEYMILIGVQKPGGDGIAQFFTTSARDGHHMMEAINGLVGLVPGEIVQRLSSAFAGIHDIAPFTPVLAPANPDEPELPLEGFKAEGTTVPIMDEVTPEPSKKRGKA